MYRMDPPDLINSNFKENSHSLLRIKADMLNLLSRLTGISGRKYYDE